MTITEQTAETEVANSTPRRICVVLVVDDLGYGGAERQVVELANNMESDRFDVHVCALSAHVPLGSRLRDAQRRLHIIELGFRYDCRTVVRVARLLRDLRADIVHGYLFRAEIVSRLAGRLARTPVVLGSERNANQTFRRRNVLIYRLTAGCADAIIANSHAGAESNGRIFRRPRSDYRVVHNGVDTERFRPGDGAATRQRLGLVPPCLVIGVFANFKPQKNHAMLFRAFRQALGSHPEARLLLVGAEPADSRGRMNAYTVQMNALINELGIRDRCLFLGHQEGVEEIYRACDMTVLPSLHEGTPNVLLESMACGVPVVATDVCDNKYVVRDGEVGYLTSATDEGVMADRITSLLADGRLRREMGGRARGWVVEEFSTQRLAEKTAAVYMDLLGAVEV